MVKEAPVHVKPEVATSGAALIDATNTEQQNGGGGVVKGKFGNDNLRDIGTWSNEQAASEKNGTVESGTGAGTGVGAHRPGPSYAGSVANRIAANSSRAAHAKPAAPGQQQSGAPAPTRAKNSAEEWDQEEWQGDLSQTQIFTASSQKKDATGASVGVASSANDQNDQSRFDSNFPIGHFNAEEATQKIKRAVGVSSCC